MQIRAGRDDQKKNLCINKPKFYCRLHFFGILKTLYFTSTKQPFFFFQIDIYFHADNLFVLLKSMQTSKSRSQQKWHVLAEVISVHGAPVSHTLFVKCPRIYSLLVWCIKKKDVCITITDAMFSKIYGLFYYQFIRKFPSLNSS